jgi:3-hydroxy-9,10-secoandrosta-1,3,5(10)-triene-9,17-dione monooxygenase reductase component
MAIDNKAFRDALRLFPSGVTVVTLRAGETVHGLTVAAFASVSPEPPLVAVIIDNSHRAHVLLETAGVHFAVNVLSADQKPLANRFGWTEESKRFEEGDWDFTGEGAPVLRDALAWLRCSVHSRLPAGTHTIYVGAVEAIATPRADAAPLLYWNRDYRGLAGV